MIPDAAKRELVEAMVRAVIEDDDYWAEPEGTQNVREEQERAFDALMALRVETPCPECGGKGLREGTAPNGMSVGLVDCEPCDGRGRVEGELRIIDWLMEQEGWSGYGAGTPGSVPVYRIRERKP